MSNNKVKKKKLRQKFKAVDVWRAEFGPISVRAILDVYSTTFGVELHNMKNIQLSHCINRLRKHEDPNYKEQKDSGSY